MTRNRSLVRLLADRRGATLIEFAIISPAMILTLMGLGDILYALFVQSALDGAVQRAGRDSTLQSAQIQGAAIEARVVDLVDDIAPNVRITFQRTAYRTFLDMRPEDFTDRNANNRRDPGECYDDRNANAAYDISTGRSGSGGGADDVVDFSATATFPRIFPMAGMLGWSREQQLVSRTILKNQPFARQAVAAAVVRICTP